MSELVTDACIIVLSYSDIRPSVSHLLDCYTVVCTGKLTIDQDIIPIGSNLTVHCRSNTVKCGRIFVMKFDGKEVLRQTSCSSVTAQVVVNEPKSWLHCSAEQDGKFLIVCGRDIVANRMFILTFYVLYLHHGV